MSWYPSGLQATIVPLSEEEKPGGGSAITVQYQVLGVQNYSAAYIHFYIVLQ